MMMIENEHFNCMKTISCKVTTIEHDDNRKLGCEGVGAIIGVTGVSGVYWGLAGTLGIKGPEGVLGHQGHWGLLRM